MKSAEIKVRTHHGMCLVIFAGNGYKWQKRSFLRGSARISAEAANGWRFAKERSIGTCRFRTIWRGDSVKKDIVTASPATLREKGLGGSPALNLYKYKKAPKRGISSFLECRCCRMDSYAAWDPPQTSALS